MKIQEKEKAEKLKRRAKLVKRNTKNQRWMSINIENENTASLSHKYDNSPAATSGIQLVIKLVSRTRRCDLGRTV